MSNRTSNRRDFLRAGVGVAAAAPYFAWSPRTLADEPRSQNDRLSIGLIGAGGMGLGNMAVAQQGADLVAVADPDSNRCERANQSHGRGKAAMHEDYRHVLDRADIDVVLIATPDHWHAKPLIEAMLAGKDVYCEKPLTLTIDEGKLIRKVQQETGRIVQVGTQQRSTYELFYKAMAIVADGRLGKIKKLQAAIGGAPHSPALPIADPPANLNWDRWLGPAPVADYRFLEKKRKPNEKWYRPHTNGHYEFRWWYEYSGGKLTDWGAHHVDIATWALTINRQNDVPVSIDGAAKHPVDFVDGQPVQKDRYNTATAFNFIAKYADGVELTIRNDTDNGVLIEGDKGRIFVNRGKLVGKPVEELQNNPLPEDAFTKVYDGLPRGLGSRQAHWANFFRCVKERKQPISDVDSHMKMLNVCHLAGICARLGRELAWDGETEQIVGDEQANAMLSRPYRKGYEIEGV